MENRNELDQKYVYAKRAGDEANEARQNIMELKERIRKFYLWVYCMIFLKKKKKKEKSPALKEKVKFM